MPNCPICETEYIDVKGHICVTCGFDLTPYPISMNGIPEVYLDRERGKLKWGQKLWIQLQEKSNLSQTEHEKILQAQTDLQQRFEWINGENAYFKQRITQLETALRQAETNKESQQNQNKELEQQNQQLIANQQTAQGEIRKLQSQITQLNEQLNPPRPRSHLQTFRFETAQITSYDSHSIQIQRSQKEAKQFVHDLGNGIKLEMVEIPAGRFLMGAVPNEANASSAEYPQHSVNIPSFFMSKYQITQSQYKQVMGTNPSIFKGDLLLPVEHVNWEEAKAFCAKLGHPYRLPSEAEWEYACRAGSIKPFYFGDTISPSMVNYNGDLPYAGASKGERRAKTTRVGSFAANRFGLFDMHGNVWEWCEDDWQNNYNGVPVDGSAWKTSGNTEFHVLRGGSWHYDAYHCRSASRYKYDLGDGHVGFRVASSIFA